MKDALIKGNHIDYRFKHLCISSLTCADYPMPETGSEEPEDEMEKGKGSDCTSLVAAALAPAVNEELADAWAAAPAAPLMVTCSWTPYLPSHLSSLLIWVELVIVSLISASVEEAT